MNASWDTNSPWKPLNPSCLRRVWPWYLCVRLLKAVSVYESLRKSDSAIFPSCHAGQHNCAPFFETCLNSERIGMKSQQEGCPRDIDSRSIKHFIFNRMAQRITEMERAILLPWFGGSILGSLHHPHGDIDSVHPSIRIPFQYFHKIESPTEGHLQAFFFILNASDLQSP